MYICFWFRKFLVIKFLIIYCGLVFFNIIVGFLLFSFSVICVKWLAVVLVIFFFVVVELVKLIFVIWGCDVRVVLYIVFDLVMILKMLLGILVLLVSFVMCNIVSGVVFEGLIMIE